MLELSILPLVLPLAVALAPVAPTMIQDTAPAAGAAPLASLPPFAGGAPLPPLASGGGGGGAPSPGGGTFISTASETATSASGGGAKGSVRSALSERYACTRPHVLL